MLSQVTRVKNLTTVRRTRLLPVPGRITVTVGQEVNAVQVVARAPAVGDFHILRANDVLGIPAESLADYLLVEVGARLERGTPLMRKKTRLGGSKIFRSPLEGIVQDVRDGCLILRKAEVSDELRAMVPGRVVSIVPDRGVVLETSGTLIQAAWDSGKESYGTLVIASNSAWEEMAVERVGARARGAVLVTGKVEHVESLDNLMDRGIYGLITGGMPAELCRRSEEIPFPVFITDGIGPYPMSEPIFNLLQQSEGRQASLLAGQRHDQYLRSEIVIPLPTRATPGESEVQKNTVVPGSSVRILRTGHRTQIGKVTRVYQTGKRADADLHLPGADVKMADGREIFVPYTNLDLIV